MTAPFLVLADSLYIHSYFNLTTKAISLQWQLLFISANSPYIHPNFNSSVMATSP